MNQKRTFEAVTDLLYETIGSILIAAAVHNFALAAEFPMTGFSGIAIIYTRGSSTGDADFLIIALKIINHHLRLGTIAFSIDIGIILIGGLLFRDFDGIIYGILVNYLFAVMVDKVFYGLNSGKLAFIATKHGKEISDLIEECSNRGSTILKSRGGYRLEEKETVLVVSNSKQMYRILQQDTEHDKAAFIILLKAHEIHGKGFCVL